MTSVKHFTSTMTGAPVVSRTAGSLIAMLDACLVDGFGLKSVDSIVVASNVATMTISTGHSFTEHSVALISGATPAGLNGEKKVVSVTASTVTFAAPGISDQTATGTITAKLAGAGWAKVFSGTNKAVYRSSDPASTQIYIRIDDTDAAFARPTGYLTMSDVDTGTGAFSTTYFNRANGSAGNRRWWLAANKSFVMFGIDTNMNNGGYALCAFGDIIPRRTGDPYRFLISGANNTATSWGYTDTLMSNLTRGGQTVTNNNTNTLARSFTQIGSGVAVASAMLGIANGAVNSGLTTVVAFPNGGDNSMVVCDAYIMEGTTIRGRTPGLYLSPQPVQGLVPNDYVITGLPELPGRTLLWKQLGSSSTTLGGHAIDVTGPWE